jgi:hypothetical protein
MYGHSMLLMPGPQVSLLGPHVALLGPQVRRLGPRVALKFSVWCYLLACCGTCRTEVHCVVLPTSMLWHVMRFGVWCFVLACHIAC